MLKLSLQPQYQFIAFDFSDDKSKEFQQDTALQCAFLQNLGCAVPRNQAGISWALDFFSCMPPALTTGCPMVVVIL